MKIGIFDSGLGGLFTMKAVVKALPEYDYVYLGDTKRLPYGNRSHETIYEFLKEGVDFLFSQNCALVLVACNTASAEALRPLQQKWLSEKYPDRRVLGVIIPIVEECSSFRNIGLIGTAATISSGVYEKEFNKRAPQAKKLFSLAAPLLVPLIENNGEKWIRQILREYLSYFKSKKIDALILGCTHYPIVKNEFKKLLPKNVKIISQETVSPKKTKAYLKNHPEISSLLSKNESRTFYVTDTTSTFEKMAKKWFGKNVVLQKTELKKLID